MTKAPTLTTIASGYASNTQLNNNFDAIQTAFENTLSLDGSTPNAMNADLDMDSNNILNVNEVGTSYLRINGQLVVPSDYAFATEATDVDYNQGGTGAVGRTVASRLQDTVSVKDFGAVGNGVADDTIAIQAAFNSSTQRVLIPNGTYKITASLTLDGNKSVEGAGSNVGMSTIRLENSAVLEVIKVGSTSIFGGSIKNIVTDRVTYSGATENIGWAFYDMAGCVIEGISSRLSKYNFYFKPSTGQRVAYNTFINISGVGGFYNMAGALSGTGFVNENVFLGGRMFTTADTNTNIYFDFSNNHNRWVAMSCEGSGSQAFYIEGTALLNSHSNVVWNCRTEGTWSVDDVVLGTNTQRNTVDCRSLYTTVTDNGNNNSIFTSTLNKFSTGDNNSKTMVVQRIGASTSSTPALTVSDQYAVSGDSFGILVESGRDTATGYIIQGKRKSDGLDRFHVTSQGSLYASTNLEAGQSAWNFSPLKLGNYVLWVDSTGDLRIKNGAPASDTDGTIVGTQS